MRIGTSKIMNNIDKFCIETLGISGIVLMENAALKMVSSIDKDYDNVLVVCGTGNNGGDGMACARHFKAEGKEVKVFYVGNIEKMSHDCKINYNILINMGVNVTKINSEEDTKELITCIKEADVVVDAVFGTGLNREVKGIYSKVISCINEESKYIAAVDVPSGMNGDTGAIMGNCVRANKTISFEMYKKGFLNYNNEQYTGEIVIENIGVPDFILDKFHENEYITDKEMILNNIRVRGRYEHKGNFGRVTIFAGSNGYSGAAYIATEAAVKCGSGLVTLCTAEELQGILSGKLVEAMTVSVDDKNRIAELICKSDAVAVGPGMGNTKETFETLERIISKVSCPIVIDADGLNVLKDKLNILKFKKNKIILTPHPGEFSRISGITVKDIEHDRINISKKFARENDVILVLKGYHTVVTDGESVYVNSTGNSAMASGGMGDCLTGIIVSLIGQGYSPIMAAVCGTFIHGYCGDVLSEKMSNVTASDIIYAIPYCIKNIYNKIHKL